MALISPLSSSSALLLRTLARRSQIKLNNINININRNNNLIVISKRKLCVVSSSNNNDNSESVTLLVDSVITNNDSVVNNIKGLGNMLEIRVGKIVNIRKHDDADSLYVEQVDIGQKTGERVICSGLVNYIPIHLLQDKKVVVLANLKPRNMRGVKSSGMLMAASDSSHENVELLEPPEDSLPGDRVWFGDVDEKENLPDPASPNQIQKKKIWESVQPHLKTNASCVALLGKDVMRTSAGVVRCKSLKDANIS